MTAAASEDINAAGDNTVKYDTFTNKYKQVTKGTAVTFREDMEFAIRISLRLSHFVVILVISVPIFRSVLSCLLVCFSVFLSVCLSVFVYLSLLGSQEW